MMRRALFVEPAALCEARGVYLDAPPGQFPEQLLGSYDTGKK